MVVILFQSAHAQTPAFRPELPAPIAPAQPSPNANVPIRSVRSNAPDAEHVFIESVSQESEGSIRHFRGMVRIETTDMQLKADELDYNQDTGDVQARGHVHFEHFLRNEKIDCDKADYNIDTEKGKFYDISGTATTRINARPGLLTTQNPFYFQGIFAERLEDHYIVHSGFLTDCLLPRPWWRLRASTFNVVPGEHAIAHNAIFYVGKIPIFYFPVFYKSLEKEPRKSGFLVPNIGHSSLRGFVLGLGYYWAISRSYDLTYRAQYFSEAGLAHHLDFRGAVNQTTGFDFLVDGIEDKRNLNPPPSGALVVVHAHSILGNGWEARGELNYLTSFAFRLNYTESFNESVYSETHSVGYVDKHWRDFATYFVAEQNVNFQSTAPGDAIVLRKLPEANVSEREHEFSINGWPLWFSFRSSTGLVRRSQLLFQTRQFVPRLDFTPQVTTALRWYGIQLIPTFGVRETAYGSSALSTGVFTGHDINRFSRDFTLDLVLPSLGRVFDAPSWMGDKVKHVIEPRITYKDVSGIDNFEQIIRFDEADVVSNTNQVEFSLTNRLLAKDKNGTISDMLTWQLWYDRYFDPTFGGAIVPGTRNVVESTLELTGYSFLDGYRHSSPIVSALRLQSRVGFEWRADYDPVRHNLADSSVSVDYRIRQYFLSFGHTDLHTDPVLAPTANQLRWGVGYGSSARRGWSFGANAYYDYLNSVLQFAQAQATYNTDCCGISIQYRRINLGIRDETQFRVAFAVSNIGTFGTLKRQESIF